MEAQAFAVPSPGTQVYVQGRVGVALGTVDMGQGDPSDMIVLVALGDPRQVQTEVKAVPLRNVSASGSSGPWVPA